MPSSRRPLAATLCTALAVAALAGCADSPGSQEAFCEQVAKVPALEAVLARFSETDPDALADRIDKARAAYEDLAAAAPDAIDDEADDVVDLVDEILAAVEDNPDDPAAAADQLRAAVAEHPEAEASRAAVAAYAEEACGVQLDATLTEATEGSSTTEAPSTTSTAPTAGTAPTTATTPGG